MTGHTAAIYTLAFSAESSLLVSGGADWTVRCWDVKSSGGPAGKPRENGNSSYTPMGLASSEASIVRGYGEDDSLETYVFLLSTRGIANLSKIISTDLLATFPTKRTPVSNVQFTSRNLCLVGGAYLSPDR